MSKTEMKSKEKNSTYDKPKTTTKAVFEGDSVEKERKGLCLRPLVRLVLFKKVFYIVWGMDEIKIISFSILSRQRALSFRKRGFLFFLLSSIIFSIKIASATIYAPGATLEPDCAPGSPNCGVSVPALTNIGNTDLTLSGSRTLSFAGNQLTFDGTAGDIVFNDSGSIAISGNFITPKGADYPTTGSQNNVNLGSGSLFRYTGVSGATFTGIVGGADGRVIHIMNANTTQSLVINNEDTNSSAANRVETANGQNLVVAPNAMVSLQYDAGASRWRVIALPVSTVSLVQGGNAFGAPLSFGTTDANILNFITSGATRFSLAAGSATLTGTGATAITTDNSLSLSSAAGAGLSIISGTTGTLTLDSGTTGDINIGTGANAKSVIIGNATGATNVNLDSGTGNISLNGDVIISAGHTFTTGTGITIQNSNALDLAADNTVINMSGAGTLGLNTVDNRAITTGAGLLTVGGAASVTGLSTFNDNIVVNGDVTLGNTLSDRIIINGVVPGALPIVFDGATADANFLTLAINDPTVSHVATIPVLSGDDTFVFLSQLQALLNKTLIDPILNGSLSGTGIDIDATLSANSDTKIASQKATKAYIDSKAAGLSFRPPVNLIDFIETNPGANVVGQSAYIMDGFALTNGMRVIFGNNAVPVLYNDKVFLVGGVGASITLTLQTDGQAGNGDPTEGDTVFILSGTVNINKTFVWSATAHHWEEASSLAGALVATNNLSDLADTAAARTNLGLGTTDAPTFSGLNIINNGNILQTGTGTLTSGTGLLTASGNASVVGLLTGQAGAVIAGANITLNHDSNFNVDLATGSSTGAVSLGGGSGTVAVNSTTWDISTLGAASGFTSLTSTGVTALTVDSGTTGDVNLGTGSNAKIVTIGNTVGATALNLNSGSGGINFGGNTAVTGANTFTTGTGTTVINSPLVTLAGNSTVLDMTGTGTLGLNTVTNRAITTGTGIFTTGGDLTVNGSFTAPGNFITPKGTDFTTTGVSNNVNFGVGSLFHYAGAAPATITGIAGGVGGRLIRINNVSSSNVTFTNLDGGSLAANRIVTPGGVNLVIAPDVAVQFQYNADTLTWHVVSLPATATSIGGFAFLQGGNGFGTTGILGTTDANALNLITSGATRFSLAAGAATLTGSGATTVDASAAALNLGTSAATSVSLGKAGITTTNNGALTASQLLTAANGFTLTTGALNLTATSGSLTLSGLSASSISTGANSLIFTSSNFSTTATGINATAIGATTPSTGAFTTLSSTGLTNLASAGASNVTIATTGTGNVTVGNATGTFALASNGGLNVTTAGALTGVASIDTIAHSATALTFAGAGTLSSTTTNALTIDSGTTGNVNLGTGANAKTVAIGNTTGATAVNINSGTGNVNLTVGPTSSSGKVQIGNSATATPDLLVLDNGTADPTGTNGGMYYNTSTNKFRCFQNGAWINCINGDRQLVPKSTDQSVTSSTTLTNDTALTFSVGAGETWIFNFFLFLTNAASAQPDFKAALLGAAGWTCSAQLSGSEAAGAAFPQAVTTDCDNAPTAMVNNNIASDGGNGFNARIQGVVTTTSAGSITLQFAQNTSSANAITVKGGSYVLAFKVGGADLAEMYYSQEPLTSGTVVSIDPGLTVGVTKSAGIDDKNVLGIVTTQPGMVLGDNSAPTGVPVLVALSGRVPVKVSIENGRVKPGDYLTASSTPGVAMKATKPGMAIGQVLQDMSSADGDVGSVLVFVKNTYFDGERAFDESGASLTGTALLQKMLTDKTQPALAVQASEIMTDNVSAGLEIVAPRVMTQELLADIIKPSLSKELAIELGIDGQITIGEEGKSPKAAIDAFGNATFAGTLTAKSIKADSIEGLEIYTDSIKSLVEKYASVQATSQETAAKPASGTDAPALATHPMDLILKTFTTDTLLVKLDASIIGKLTVTGGLVVSGEVEFQGDTIFQKLATFFGDIIFKGRTTFNSDTAGFAVIAEGQKSVDITFDEIYAKQPIVSVMLATDESALAGDAVSDKNLAKDIKIVENDFMKTYFDGDIKYIVIRKNLNGFTIILNKEAPSDLQFSWVALAVKGPKTFYSQDAKKDTPEEKGSAAVDIAPNLSPSENLPQAPVPSPLPEPPALEPSVNTAPPELSAETGTTAESIPDEPAVAIQPAPAEAPEVK